MLNVKYGYRRSLLSVLYVHFDRISARFHKAYGSGPNGAVPPETMGGQCCIVFVFYAKRNIINLSSTVAMFVFEFVVVINV